MTPLEAPDKVVRVAHVRVQRRLARGSRCRRLLFLLLPPPPRHCCGRRLRPPHDSPVILPSAFLSVYLLYRYADRTFLPVSQPFCLSTGLSIIHRRTVLYNLLLLLLLLLLS